MTFVLCYHTMLPTNSAMLPAHSAMLPANSVVLPVTVLRHQASTLTCGLVGLHIISGCIFLSSFLSFFFSL